MKWQNLTVTACVPAVLALGGCAAPAGPAAPIGRVWLVDETSPDTDAEMEKALRKNLPRVEFPGIGFGDVIQFFRDVSKLNIHVKWVALRAANIDERTPVNVKLTNVTLENALRTVLDDVGGVNPLAMEIDAGVMVISTRDDPGRSRVARVYDVSDLLGPRAPCGALCLQIAREIVHRPAGIEDRADGVGPQGVALAEACRSRTRELAEALVGADRRRRAEKLTELAFATVLPQRYDGDLPGLSEFDGRLIANLTRSEHRSLALLLGALRDRPALAAATPKHAPPVATGTSPTALVEAALRQELPKLSFEGAPLGDAIQFLRDAGNLCMQVKWEALREALVDEKTPVNVTLHDVTLGRALRAVLEDVGAVQPLGYIIDEGVLTISTKSDLSRQTVIRTYDVSGLLARGLGGQAEKRKLAALLAQAMEDPPERDGGELFVGRPVRPTLADAYRGRARDLADAVAEAHGQARAERLAEVIRQTVEPELWRGSAVPGLKGNIRTFQGKLIIRHTPSAHRRIEPLLAALRGESPTAGGQRGRDHRGLPGRKTWSVGAVTRRPPPPVPFEIPPIVRPDRWPAGEKKAITRPVRILGVKTSRVYVLLLIDRSGSMLDMLDLVKKRVAEAIDALSDEQYFEVLFHAAGHAYSAFAGKLTPATRENRRRATETFKKVHAQGRTDTVAALQAACKILAPANGSESQVIFFFTDGEFADDRGVVSLARELAEHLKVVIHPVAHGDISRTGREVLHKLAKVTGGKCTIVPPAE